MTEEEQAIAKLNSKEWRMSHLYKIQTKDARLVTFKPNMVQRDYLSSLVDKNMVLKARQMGFTTVSCIDYLDETILNPNTTSAIIAHTRDDAAKLFEITKRAFTNMPQELKPAVSYDNRNEIYFADMDSKIYVDTDLRGGTTHNLHISEVGFIDKAEAKMAGILETVPKGGRITLESTANGASGYFFDEWEDPKSEFKKHFYNWLWDDQYQEPLNEPLEELLAEYQEHVMRYGLIKHAYERFQLTPEQFHFYIKKIRRQRQLVLQEYPLTPMEAFISTGRNVFKVVDLEKHRIQTPIDFKWEMSIWEKPLPKMRYVIGCDVAEGLGGDYSVIEVYNANTGEQAAEYVSNAVAPDRLGDYLVEIGNYYNKAFMVVEVNNHGRATLDSIKHRYYNIYRRQVYDKVSNTSTEALGWRTTSVTKPLLVDNLEQAVREQSIHIHSKRSIQEMRVFVQTEEPGKQGFGAEGDKHDDTVIANGLALQAIKYLPMQKKPKTMAQKKLEEYIANHGIPSYMSDTITKRNRPHQMIRREKYGTR